MQFISHLEEPSLAPLITSENVQLFYQGTQQTKQVHLMGEYSAWNPEGTPLKRLNNNLFSIKLQLPNDARIEYKFKVDEHWTLDPNNPQNEINGLGDSNSVITMPGYTREPLLKGAPRGRCSKVQIKGYQTTLYTPLHTEPQSHYPLLIFQDGQDYIQRGHTNILLDRMIQHKMIPPVIACFIHPKNRYQEYTLNPSYMRFVAETLLPELSSHYPISKNPKDRVLVGSSLGGLISAATALAYPQTFGKVLGQSSAFYFAQKQWIKELKTSPKQDIDFYLSAGRFERLVQSNRKVQDILFQKGYTFTYKEYNEGHNWSHWSHRLSHGLKYTLENNYDTRI